MDEHERIERDDRLAVRLRREARQSRPVFSATLHERMLAAIEAASAPAANADVRLQGSSRVQALSWAITVAGSIALTIALALIIHRVQPAARNVAADPGDAASGDAPGTHLPIIAPLPKTANQPLAANKETDDLGSAAEELANSATGIGDWVVTTAGESQWAGLDRDAQRALATVAGPLPFDLTFSVAASDPE
jgi:hypothetical protein